MSSRTRRQGLVHIPTQNNLQSGNAEQGSKQNSDSAVKNSRGDENSSRDQVELSRILDNHDNKTIGYRAGNEYPDRVQVHGAVEYPDRVVHGAVDYPDRVVHGAVEYPDRVVHGAVEIGIDVFPGPPNTLAISREISVDVPDTIYISRQIGTIVESPVSQEDTSKPPLSPLSPLPPPSENIRSPRPSTKKKTAPCVTYEAAMWVIHIVILVLACVDRFTWNVWPRQNTFKIGGGSAGGDKMDGLLEGPWSVKLYDILARVSGRFSILALNLMLFVRLRTVESWLCTSWVNRYLLDCSNIVNANLRLHIWNGYTMVILMLLHVWSILFPCIFHGFGAQVLVGTPEWPLSERKPPGFKDANSTARMMSLQVDDVFRVVEISVIFGVMAPLSYYWFWRKWHIAIHVHRIMAAVFCIDIVRRHTHPHSILLNIPVFVIWILDKVIYSYWGYSNLEQFHRIMLGEDYMVLMWKSDAPLSKTLGPNFYLKLKDSSISENAHAFTAFQNRRLVQVKDAPGGWNTGIVIRVYRNQRKYALSKKDRSSHTGRIATAIKTSAVLEAYGPYTGEMSELIKQGQNRTKPRCCGVGSFLSGVTPSSCQTCLSAVSGVWAGEGPVVLIGTGSGINYLLDAIQYRFTGGNQLYILWSTGDNDLFSWARKLVNQIVTAEDTHLRIVLANTDKISMIHQAWSVGQEQRGSQRGGRRTMSPEEWYNSQNNYPDIVRYLSGRIPFQEEIPPHSHVFFQGSRAVRLAVAAACVKNQCSAHFGRGSNNVRKIVFKELAERSLVYVNRSFRRLSSAIDDLDIKRRFTPNVSFRSTPNRSRQSSMRSREPSMRRGSLQPDVLNTTQFRDSGRETPPSRNTSIRRNTLHFDTACRGSERRQSLTGSLHGSTIFENRVYHEEQEEEQEGSSCEEQEESSNVEKGCRVDLSTVGEKEHSEENREVHSTETTTTSTEKGVSSSRDGVSLEDFTGSSFSDTRSYSYGDYSDSEDSYNFYSDDSC